MTVALGPFGHVVRAAHAGLVQYFPDHRPVLVNADASSRDGTARVVTVALSLITVLIVLGLWFMTVRAVAEPLEYAVRVAHHVASGDLTTAIQADGSGEFGKLLAGMKSMIENLTRMVSNIRVSADAIYTSASEVASGNANLSQRTEEQASTLEQTASSMEQLTEAVRANTESARKANALSMSSRQAKG